MFTYSQHFYNLRSGRESEGGGRRSSPGEFRGLLCLSEYDLCAFLFRDSRENSDPLMQDGGGGAKYRVAMSRPGDSSLSEIS